MADQRQTPDGRSNITVTPATAVVLFALTLIVGIAVGRGLAGGGAGAAAQESNASATGTAEADELSRLRTQVAELAACTPAGSPVATLGPSPTATPTPIPPAAMGQSLAYADNWTVIVNSVSSAAPSDAATASGKYLQVSVTVTNNGDRPRTFPFFSWVLVDESGRTFAFDASATSVIVGSAPFSAVDPSQAAQVNVVFDVALDAGERFVLESTMDATFRVAVETQTLG
jgi:hypothetical protein